MVPKREQQRMRRLLSEAINVLCKASLPFKAKFTVEGLLGITLDDEEILLINVDEIVELPGETSQGTANEKSSASASVSAESDPPSRPSSTQSNAATKPVKSPSPVKRSHTDNAADGSPFKRHRPRGYSTADSIIIKEEPGSDSESSDSGQPHGSDIPTKPISRIYTSKPRTNTTPIKKEKTEKSSNQSFEQPSNTSSQGFGVGDISFSSEMSLSEVTSLEMTGGDGAGWSADAWASDSQSQPGPSTSQTIPVSNIKMEPTQPDPGGSNQELKIQKMTTRGTQNEAASAQNSPPFGTFTTAPAPIPFPLWSLNQGTMANLSTMTMTSPSTSRPPGLPALPGLGFLGPFTGPKRRPKKPPIIPNPTSPPKCSKCSEVFDTFDNFVKHMRKNHETISMFYCRTCYKGFDMQHKLQVHEPQHAKKHTCQFCGRSFGQKVNLKNHMRTHTGEEPYACLYCSMTFKSKTHLNWHMKRCPYIMGPKSQDGT